MFRDTIQIDNNDLIAQGSVSVQQSKIGNNHLITPVKYTSYSKQKKMDNCFNFKLIVGLSNCGLDLIEFLIALKRRSNMFV